jgi:hypothetical protein
MNRATSRDLSILRPYNGSSKTLPDGCPKVMPTFPGEPSARVSYSFNSLGFRGDEFEVTADRHVFVCGGSVTFGLGLDYAEAWVSVFRRGYAERHDLPETGVNLQNFSSSGCCNGYIARTLIGQCTRFQPALVLAELTSAHHSEILLDGRSYNIGRWCLSDRFDPGMRQEGHDDELRQLIRRKSEVFYELDSDLLAGQDLLKNALLLQLFFQRHDIPFLIGIPEVRSCEIPDDELLAPWMEALDPDRVFTIPKRCYHLDVSEAPGHPGPEGSRAIADYFLGRYQEIYGQNTPVTRSQTPRGWNRTPGDKSETPKREDSVVYPLF